MKRIYHKLRRIYYPKVTIKEVIVASVPIKSGPLTVEVSDVGPMPPIENPPLEFWLQ